MRMREIAAFLCLSLVLMLGLSPQANAQQDNPASMSQTTAAPAATDGVDHPVAAERNPRYRIGRGDVLVISFPLTPELNQKVMVQPDGFVSLQNAGSIHLEGFTVPAAIEAVKKAYANILHEPIVDLDLADFQKPFFTVLGEVGKPGQYELRRDITVSQAIAVASGFTPNAKTQVFLYRAVSANWAEVRELKLKDLLNGKDISEDVHLRSGDMIFVPEKFITSFKKYVPYSFSLSPLYGKSF